jgi:UDP-N-acetylglucosamine 2-epimerase (non-hydrolysing)
MTFQLCLVAGTRPNFMKVAPIRRVLDARRIPVRMIHTGQHFDAAMSDVFFRDLDMPPPEVLLRAGGGSHAEQTATVLVGVEAELLRARPSAIVVVGDVTSTLAAALAASKLGVPIVHVEAGLRSRDWSMPEEINRVLTDQLSDLLLTTSPEAETNLRVEGIASERIRFVGNVMIDSLLHAVGSPTDVVERLGLQGTDFAVATLHRPANVDNREALTATLDVLETIANRIPVVFPVHPRTLARIEALGVKSRLDSLTSLRLVDPLGYRDFVTLESRARLVATDSGGIQEETTAIGIPCLTLREGTERPITVTEGTNVIVGLDARRIASAVDDILAGKGKKGRAPAGWDGRAAERVADSLEEFARGNPPPRIAGPRA